MNSTNSAGLSMYEFFLEELKSLKVRTGIRQWETLNESAKPAEEIHGLITAMEEATKEAPFDMVRADIKQRVIRDAVYRDDKFIGYNVKFVKRALHAWWGVYGGKILEARDQKEANVYEKVQLTDEQKKKIDELANGYLQQLKNGFPAPPKMTPKEVQEEGQIRPKKPVVRSSPLSYYESRERHIRYVRENYDLYTGKPLPTWIPEEEWMKKLNQLP